MKKKLDLSLLIACLIGGAVGGYAANLLFERVEQSWNPVLSVGTFFAIVSFSICFLGYLSEIATRNLTKYTGSIWSVGRSAGILFLTPIAFFVLGVVFQFIYGLGTVKKTEIKADNFIVIVDNSGSALSTDPAKERFSSIVDFSKSMQDGNGIMITVFESDAQVVFPFTEKYAGIDNDISDVLAPFEANGGTNIEAALEASIQGYGSGNGKKTVALLFSDGEGALDMDYITKEYQKAGIAIFTISFAGSGNSGRRLLEELSDKTGGQYLEIGAGLSFDQSYQKVKNYKVKRNLLGKRVFTERKKVGLTILRIFLLLLLAVAIVPLIAYILDSEDVLRKNLVYKIVEGLLGGMIVEFGFRAYRSGSVLRMIFSLLMAMIIAWCSMPDVDAYLAGETHMKNYVDDMGEDPNRLGGSNEIANRDSKKYQYEVKGRDK